MADYAVPVFSLGAELDGGLGRPGYLHKSVISSDTWAASNGGINSAEHVAKKPVVILPGLDHSDFCPGFQVPGDIYPSDVSKDEAMLAIGGAVSAFLNVQSYVSMSDSIKKLQSGQSFTRDDLLQPLVTAYTQTGEKDENPTRAPWCEIAQKKLAGISPEDEDRLDMISVYAAKAKPFEDTRVSYKLVENNHV